MTRIPLLFVVALVCQAEDSTIFPAEVGYRWTYQSKSRRKNVFVRTEKEWKAGPKRTVDVLSAEQRGTDGRVFVFETSAEGARTTRQTLLRTSRGLYATADGEGDPLIKFPLESGERWPKGFANEGMEEVEVPAGTFSCWKIHDDHPMPLGSKSRTRWYAKGVGLVKEFQFNEIEGGGSEDVFELEKFEKDPAKK
jgi:hypothetical protein